MKKLLVIIMMITALFLMGCDTELGHDDHDHDGDGIQDHSAEEHNDHEDEEAMHDDHAEDEHDDENTVVKIVN